MPSVHAKRKFRDAIFQQVPPAVPEVHEPEEGWRDIGHPSFPAGAADRVFMQCGRNFSYQNLLMDLFVAIRRCRESKRPVGLVGGWEKSALLLKMKKHGESFGPGSSPYDPIMISAGGFS
jgi:hypothetical protein